MLAIYKKQEYIVISTARKQIWDYQLNNLRKENKLLTIKIKKQREFLLKYESEENLYLSLKRKIENEYK